MWNRIHGCTSRRLNLSESSANKYSTDNFMNFYKKELKMGLPTIRVSADSDLWTDEVAQHGGVQGTAPGTRLPANMTNTRSGLPNTNLKLLFFSSFFIKNTNLKLGLAQSRDNFFEITKNILLFCKILSD